LLRNSANGEVYVRISTNDLDRRLSEHSTKPPTRLAKELNAMVGCLMRSSAWKCSKAMMTSPVLMWRSSGRSGSGGQGILPGGAMCCLGGNPRRQQAVKWAMASKLGKA
jgi:hypothetical protein